jgi:drug/metabolite transporter (DMT)-like permease
MTRKASSSGLALAAVSALSFSSLGIFATKLYAEGLSIQQTLAWRFTLASLILWAMVLVRSRFSTQAAHRPPFWKITAIALIGFTPQAGLYFIAVRLLAPGIASMILYLYPAFVLVLAALLFRRSPTRRQVLALCASLAGCAIIFYQPGKYPIIGLLVAVTVALTYAAYLLWCEKALAGVDSLYSTAFIMSAAAIVYWIWVLAGGGEFHVPGSLKVWALVAGIAVFSTVIPITTLFEALKRIDASETSLVSTIEPLSTAMLSAVFLGETLSPVHMVGGVFIIAGVVILRLPSRSRR